MNLAFDFISTPAEITLYGEGENQLTEAVILADDTGNKRNDILKNISSLLEKHKVVPQDIRLIIFVNGPGRFTAVRTACIVANSFAEYGCASLIPVSQDEFQRLKPDFLLASTIYQNRISTHAEPYFGAEPNISSNKKNF